MGDKNQGALTESESTELVSLKGEMADPRGVNFDGQWADHYSHNEKKQSRARELLTREAGLPLEPEDRAQPVTDDPAPEGLEVTMTEAEVAGSLDTIAAMGTIGGAWANELRNSGDLEALEVVEDVRADIVADFGATAPDVIAAFAGLSENCQAAAYREFGTPYVPQLPPASPDDLAEFNGTSAGQILAKEWGQDAGRRLAVALFRWERLTENLSDTEFAELDDFYRLRLRPQERAAVLRRLAP